MFTKVTDCITLNNGEKIPCLGYGTWQTPSGDMCRENVLDAIKAGYRHIDTAAGYGNEADVGAAVKASGVKREEIFVTTKHWISERGYKKTVAAVDASLKALGLDYLDLYLVHWPCVDKTSENWKEINASTWRGFEQCVRDGKIKSIGVSNYLPKQILALEETAEIKPAVNQIESHPGYDQISLVRWCQAHGMAVEAWSPLGCGAVLADKTLNEIAAKYGKSSAQICIRYALQNNVIPMPKSNHAERIVQNMQVFDFNLTDEDMIAIATIPPTGYSTYHPTEAPADTLYGGSLDME